MEAVVHLDTHVVVWLFAGLVENIPPPARDLIERDELVVSPMVLLELEYLHEIKRLKARSDTVFTTLGRSIGLTLSGAPFSQIVAESRALKWTRDPFDRLIVGTALADSAVLLSADETIRKHVKSARWA